MMFKLSWNKGEIGTNVNWIGATLQLVKENGKIHRVRTTLSEERMRKVKDRAEAFLAQTSAQRTEVKEFAGLASWIGSVVKAARPYAQMVWAAACAAPAGWETHDMLATRRLDLPLRWFAAMATGGESVRCRCYMVEQPKKTATITFDASLTGGGATIDIHGRQRWMSCEWTRQDWAYLWVDEVNPKYQPLWEAYMLLVAIETWAYLFDDDVGKLFVKGDAQGVLQGAIKGRGKMPKLNVIIAEIQLLLAATRFDLTAIHIWSERNGICDALSRLAEGAKFPSECARWPESPRSRTVGWRILWKEDRSEKR